MCSEENIFDSKEFKVLGLTRQSFLRYDKQLQERAKLRTPNEKFGKVNEALTFAKKIAEENEANVRVEYYYDDATITIEGELFDFIKVIGCFEELKQIINIVDMFSIMPIDAGVVRLEFDLKAVFDM